MAPKTSTENTCLSPSLTARERLRFGRWPGFTLVESLVVISIVGVLLSLVLPAVQAAREAARRVQCQNNLKQLGLAFHGFLDAYGGFPALKTETCEASRPVAAHSWPLDLLPYLEQEPIRKAYRLTEAYDSPNNAEVVRDIIRTFQCPANPAPLRRVPLYGTKGSLLEGASSEPVSAGAIDYFAHGSIASGDLPGCPRKPVLVANHCQPIANLLDGSSQTILLNEVAMRPANYVNGLEQAGPVASPQAATWGGFAVTDLATYDIAGVAASDAPLDAPCAVNCNNDAGIYAFHPSGANTLLCDGSVRFLSRLTAARIVIALATRNGGELLSDDF